MASGSIQTVVSPLLTRSPVPFVFTPTSIYTDVGFVLCLLSPSHMGMRCLESALSLARFRRCTSSGRIVHTVEGAVALDAKSASGRRLCVQTLVCLWLGSPFPVLQSISRSKGDITKEQKRENAKESPPGTISSPFSRFPLLSLSVIRLVHQPQLSVSRRYLLLHAIGEVEPIHFIRLCSAFMPLRDSSYLLFFALYSTFPSHLVFQLYDL